jgi:hypothetical protein
MGGHINITVREKSGEIHKLEKHTSEIMPFLCDYKFLSENEEHVKKFIQDDNEYDYYISCAPQGYGLIFIDLLEKNIVSSQEYCGFQYIYVSDIINFINPLEDVGTQIKDLYNVKNDSNYLSPYKPSIEDTIIPKLKELFDNDCLKYIINRNDKKEKIEEKDFNSFVKKIIENPTIWKVSLKDCGFTYKEYDTDSIEDQIKMKNDIKNRGVEFNSTEEEDWDNAIQEIL